MKKRGNLMSVWTWRLLVECRSCVYER